MLSLFVGSLFTPIPMDDVFIPKGNEVIEEVGYNEILEIKALERWDDVELLAHLIYSECGSNYCTVEMQYLTGSVVLNRVESEYFPNDIYSVITQEGQYSSYDHIMSFEVSEQVYTIAKYLIAFGTDIPSNVVFQAQFKQGDGVYEHIQNQYYCYKE